MISVLDYPARVSFDGSGEPVVLVPGMAGTGQLFHRQVPLLARDHRVATYTLRDEATSMDVLVDDLARVVRMASPSGAPAIVVGESFGGALALSLALAHPEAVSALVILNSFPYFSPQYRLRLAISGVSLMPWGAMTLVRRLTAFRMHSPTTSRDELRTFLERTRDTTRGGYLNRLRALTTYDVRPRLGELRMPTLFVASECDRLVPAVDQARLMAALVPGADLRVLTGHGHICLIAPDVDLAAILREWRPPQRNELPAADGF